LEHAAPTIASTLTSAHVVSQLRCFMAPSFFL
jgi:hypothetical protein